MYAPFSKIEPTSDGGREVWGFASLEVVDKTGEIADFERTVQAFDKWSTEIEKATQGKSKGNIRYMHGSDAVGKMIDWKTGEKELEDGSTAKGVYIGVKVPSYETRTIGQIDDGILTGFSIGGNYADRWYDETAKAFRYAPELAETSLVDNPAVPGANFDLIRMQKGVMEVNEALLKSDENDQLHEEAEGRAKKYGISVKDGGHLTPPKGKPTDDAEYGDPTNYAYPIDDSHVKAAVGYFNHEGMREKGGYSESEWEVIGKRIADAANKLIGEGHEFKDGAIETSDERKEAEKSAWGELQKRAGVSGELSYEDTRGLVSGAINKGPFGDFWVIDTFPGYVIVEDWDNGKYYRVEYSIKGTDVTIGNTQEVQQGDWTPVKEAEKIVTTPVTKADPNDKAVDEKIAALEKELAELKGAQKKDDDEDTEKAMQALGVIKSITDRLEKRGIAISTERQKHLRHAQDHIHAALGETDKVADKDHIGMKDAEPMDAEKFAAVVLEKLSGSGVLQKSAPDVGGALAQAIESAGLAKAAEVATVTEQLAKAMEQMATLESQVKAIGEQPQTGGPYPSIYPGLGGATPWQQGIDVEKATLLGIMNKTDDPILKDRLGSQLATDVLSQSLSASRKPTA